MKRIIAITGLAVSLAAGSFAGGTWWPRQSGATHASAHEATVYTCPMHPDYRSEHPGDCPICGMRLEPHHAGGAMGGDAASHAVPHGAVQVTSDQQQAIGVRVGVVTRLAEHQAAADNRACRGGREPDVSDRRRRRRLDPERGKRHGRRHSGEGPGARIISGTRARVQECAAVVLHGSRGVLPHRGDAAPAAAAVTTAGARRRRRRGGD